MLWLRRSPIALFPIIALAILPHLLPAQVTNPEQQFGHIVGANYELVNYTALQAYWEKLAGESDRMVLDTIGYTEEGRPQLMGILTSPENHQNLSQYKDIARRMALAEGVSEEDGKHPRRVMEFQASQLGGTPELNLLHVLGLFDRIATGKELAYLKSDSTVQGLTDKLRFQTEKEWDRTIANLRALNLVSPPSHHDYDVTGEIIVAKDLRRVGALDAHPLVRTHFGDRLRKLNEAAWKEGHRILYRCLTRVTRRFPDTMQEMAPLYQAVAHGCQAGLHEEACVQVYGERILRGQEQYSWKKLGLFGADLSALACFFEEPWRRISSTLPEVHQALLFSQAALCLRALGRLTEALEPMRVGMGACAESGHFVPAAISASNVSELELTLGDIAAAVRDAKQAVGFANRTDEWDHRMTKLTTLADALHQGGQRTEALAHCQEAERIQAKHMPKYPLLGSLWGFRYCDMLLTESERAAWKRMLSSEYGVWSAELGTACHEVERRAERSLKRAVAENWLLDIALDHLTLGRAGLYRAVGESSPLDGPHRWLDGAVSKLHVAGQLQEIPRGPLSRAWLRFIEGDPDAARADLDEAWEIARRGPMRLYMADILLHRARLFRDRGALVQARELIEQCGYRRRKEELEDAEEAAKDWPAEPK